MGAKDSRGITRRALLATGAGGIAAATASKAGARALAASPELPNILWLVSEDNNPFIGVYGDRLAHTPNIDALARRSILYRNAYSNAPVCAPSRFGILTGVLPQSNAPANHMRADARLPDVIRTYPEYLRAVGYYCTNNFKTDYNCDVEPERIWDESSPRAHYRNRAAGQPFMAVFNTLTSHESRLFGVTEGKIGPADISLPAYVPDTPKIRQDYASYYNLMELMDGEIGTWLAELEEQGLADDTIVFYYSDNGGVLPRSKRYCYEEGLRCALMVHVPEKWAHLAPLAMGSEVAAPVSFIDLAPTLLSIAGLPQPSIMQGTPFLGHHTAEPKQYAFGMRNRMDSWYDFIRTVTDGRYRYIRNYMPHRPLGQVHGFALRAQGLADYYNEHDLGRLNPVQDRFFQSKPFEEFYDLTADPQEIDNRIGDPHHAAKVAELRAALDAQMLAINDNGFIPEGSASEGYLESRAPGAYPLADIMALAALAARGDPANLSAMLEALRDENETKRYWGATGLLILKDAAQPSADELAALLPHERSPQVRMVLAEALASLGHRRLAMDTLLPLLAASHPDSIRLQAINALTYVPDPQEALETLRALNASRIQGELGPAVRYLVLKLEGTYNAFTPLIDMNQTPAQFLQGRNTGVQ